MEIIGDDMTNEMVLVENVGVIVRHYLSGTIAGRLRRHGREGLSLILVPEGRPKNVADPREFGCHLPLFFLIGDMVEI